MSVTVAIHQPNFLPWSGFFDKWRQADVFILLDDVQFVRRTYLTRASIRNGNRPEPLTVPVLHTGIQEVSIREARIDRSQWNLRKLERKLETCYGHRPAFEEVSATLLPFLQESTDSLFQINSNLIGWMGGTCLGLDPAKIVLQSSFPHSGSKSALMAELTVLAGGDRYLSGGWDPALREGEPPVGAAAYNDRDTFDQYGVRLTYQNFKPASYVQGKEAFLPGLSLLDTLYTLGITGCRTHFETAYGVSE